VYEAALRPTRSPTRPRFYPGTQHGFNNDTTPRYDKAAAALAGSARWILKKNLKS